MSKFKKIDLTRVKTRKFEERETKADISRLASACIPKVSISDFLKKLPDYLKARDLIFVAKQIAESKRSGKAIIWMMGAHPIKVGLSDILIDLIDNGLVTHLAVNGAFAIHDLEMAFQGRTSENVTDGLANGSFGMVEETPKLMFEAVSIANSNGLGLGEGIGKFICEKKAKFAAHSVLNKCYTTGIPVTIHVAIGTDTICQHPGYDGAIFGKLSQDDFLILCESVKCLSGGVVLNIGSAVLMPEVFLKALTVARNIAGEVSDFTAANFDMIQHYRPNVNVTGRPVAQSGKGFNFTGHHEIMVPLLAVAIKDNLLEGNGK
jgi:hypothetical protein